MAVESQCGQPMCELMRINSWPLWRPSSIIEMYGHCLLHACSSSPKTGPDIYTKASSVSSQSHQTYTRYTHPPHMYAYVSFKTHSNAQHTDTHTYWATAVTGHIYLHTYTFVHTGTHPHSHTATLSSSEPQPSFSDFPNCIIHTVPNEMIASSYC